MLEIIMHNLIDQLSNQYLKYYIFFQLCFLIISIQSKKNPHILIIFHQFQFIKKKVFLSTISVYKKFDCLVQRNKTSFVFTSFFKLFYYLLNRFSNFTASNYLYFFGIRLVFYIQIAMDLRLNIICLFFIVIDGKHA